jgi:hypothetical protein
VSKQFYADALPIAYEQSCFYTSFRTTEASDTTALFPSWNEEVRGYVKHLAIWSDPFSWNRTLGAIEGAGMRLRVLTLCDSSFNNRTRDEGVNVCVAEWLLEVAKTLEGLRELRFFVAKINLLYKGAGDVRRAVDQVIFGEMVGQDLGDETVEGGNEGEVEMSSFDAIEHSAVLRIEKKGKRKRSVLLTIATTTEAEEAGLLKARGIGDSCSPKGFRFKDLREGEFNDIR